MPDGRHIYAKASDMAKATTCIYSQYNHALSHWKGVLRCCDECPYINIHYQERNKSMNRKHPQLGFTFIISLDIVLITV